MEMSNRESSGVVVVDLTGDIDTQAAPAVQDGLFEIVDGGAQKLLVNFTNVELITSSGLRALLTIAKTMKTSGGKFWLCAMNEDVREVFEISGFETIFNIAQDEAAALGQF